jgi:hypothetical protein
VGRTARASCRCMADAFLGYVPLRQHGGSWFRGPILAGSVGRAQCRR